MLLSVIIPAYNEEKNLEKNITEYARYLSECDFDYEIIIVNDGSTDKTKKISEMLAAKNNKIILIDNKINCGKGAAVRQGLLAGAGDYRLFIDADGATSIEHIDLIWPKFKEGFDIVIGSRNYRDIKGAEQILKQPIWKRFLGTAGNYLIRALNLTKIYDTQCGFKAFSKKAAEKILPKTKTDRWAIDMEIIAIAQKLNYKIGIIPVHWKDSGQSRVGIKGYFVTLKELLKIKWDLITDKYSS
jgi:glycosyltransferase involved in cell wall biosynthesis